MTNPDDYARLKRAARLATKEANARATAAFNALPAAERWANFERMGMLLNQQQWIFAKTMPQNPHWYTLRRKWTSDLDFQWTVAQLRAFGYRAKFAKSWYIQVDVNDHFYWTMGAPINYPNGMACTILINRKPLAALAGRVVRRYASADYGAEVFNRASSEKSALRDLVGDVKGLDILDVGGGGLIFDDLTYPSSYTAIDPTHATLDRLRSRNLNGHTFCTTLQSFVPLTASGEVGRFDVVLALAGAGSYLSDEELERIPLLLRPEGRALVTFSSDGDVVGTHVSGFFTAPRKWSAGLFPGESARVGRHILCVYQKPRSRRAADDGLRRSGFTDG